jgi:thiol-disulfide isomerase/thioredoxin
VAADLSLLISTDRQTSALRKNPARSSRVPEGKITDVFIRRAIPMALATIVFAACAPDQPSAPAPATSSESAATASPTATPPVTDSSGPAWTPKPSASEVPATLRFTGTTVEGNRFEGSSLVGKPVLLWFWAPWCPVCRGQVSQVQKIAEDHKGAISVVGVGSLDDAEAIRAFGANATDVTHLVDESGAIWKHFGVTEQSSFVLLDASGKKVFSVGYGGSDELDERVADVVR